jgi:hypothetical protein
MGWVEFTNRTGRTERWFRARATEGSTCSADIQHRIRLLSPPDTDYDLYVYIACGVLWGNSNNGPGIVDEVTISRSDDGFADDSFDYWVLVKYYSGASCAVWRLEFIGHGC